MALGMFVASEVSLNPRPEWIEIGNISVCNHTHTYLYLYLFVQLYILKIEFIPMSLIQIQCHKALLHF